MNIAAGARDDRVDPRPDVVEQDVGLWVEVPVHAKGNVALGAGPGPSGGGCQRRRAAHEVQVREPGDELDRTAPMTPVAVLLDKERVLHRNGQVQSAVGMVGTLLMTRVEKMCG